MPEVRAVIDVPYKTAVRMLDRVCDPLVTYKGKLDARKFGKPVTYYITQKGEASSTSAALSSGSPQSG